MDVMWTFQLYRGRLPVKPNFRHLDVMFSGGVDVMRSLIGRYVYETDISCSYMLIILVVGKPCCMGHLMRASGTNSSLHMC